MRNRILGGVVAGVLAGLALTSPAHAVPAASAADEGLPAAKAAIITRIDARLTALAREGAAIDRAENLTDPHRAALTDIVDSASSGLTELKSQVEAETTLAALRADATAMVNDYRVFTLVGPQVRLTVAADAESVAIAKAQEAHDKLAALVAAVSDRDTSAAVTDLAELQAAIDAARSTSAGQVDTLLAIEPGPDTTAIRNGVAAVRRSLGATRDSLRTALAEGRAVAQFLRAL